MEYINKLKSMFTYDFYTNKEIGNYSLSLENDKVKLKIDQLLCMKNYIIDDIDNKAYEKFSIDFLYKKSHKILNYNNKYYALGININDNKIELWADDNILNKEINYDIDLSKYTEDDDNIYLVDKWGNTLASIEKKQIENMNNNNLPIEVLNSILVFVINNKIKI